MKFPSGSLPDGAGRIPQPYSNMGRWRGALPAPSSESQPRAGLLPLGCFCSQPPPWLLSLPLELVAPELNCSLLSQILSHSWFPWCLGSGRQQPLPQYVPQSLDPGSWQWWGARPCQSGGSETHLGSEAQALQRLLPEEDILNSSKCLLSQICTAEIVGQSSGSSCALPGEPGPPTPEYPAGGQALAHSCTRPAHSSAHTLPPILTHPQLDFQVDCSVV